MGIVGVLLWIVYFAVVGFTAGYVLGHKVASNYMRENFEKEVRALKRKINHLKREGN